MGRAFMSKHVSTAQARSAPRCSQALGRYLFVNSRNKRALNGSGGDHAR